MYRVVFKNVDGGFDFNNQTTFDEYCILKDGVVKLNSVELKVLTSMDNIFILDFKDGNDERV